MQRDKLALMRQRWFSRLDDEKKDKQVMVDEIKSIKQDVANLTKMVSELTRDSSTHTL